MPRERAQYSPKYPFSKTSIAPPDQICPIMGKFKMIQKKMPAPVKRTDTLTFS